MKLKFHDGLQESIDVDRMTDFDVQAIKDVIEISAVFIYFLTLQFKILIERKVQCQIQ